jgi:hypothetical protein
LANRSGALDEAGFSAAKDDALMRCLAISGDTLAVKEKNNTRHAPYACGEVLQYLAAAILKDDGRDMLAIWQALLRRQDGLSYGWSEYFAELNVLAGAAGQARVAMLQELVTGDLAWRDMLASLEREGLLRKLDSAEQNRPAQSHFYAHLTLSHMLDSHCRGRRGYLLDGAVYTFDAPLDSCTDLPDKFRIVGVNGHRLASAGYDAYLEQARRCAAGEPLELEGEIGERRTLACTARFRPDLLYSFGSHH